MYLRRGVRNCCEPDWHREDNRLWNADDTAIANTRQACRVQGGFTFCTRENLPSEEGACTMTYGFFVALFDTKYHGLVDTLVVMDKYHETHPGVLYVIAHLPAKGVQQIASTNSHCYLPAKVSSRLHRLTVIAWQRLTARKHNCWVPWKRVATSTCCCNPVMVNAITPAGCDAIIDSGLGFYDEKGHPTIGPIWAAKAIQPAGQTGRLCRILNLI